MTDPETADVTYIEPLNVDRLEQIIAKERPDAPVSYTHLLVIVPCILASCHFKYKLHICGTNTACAISYDLVIFGNARIF